MARDLPENLILFGLKSIQPEMPAPLIRKSAPYGEMRRQCSHQPEPGNLVEEKPCEKKITALTGRIEWRPPGACTDSSPFFSMTTMGVGV
jgi:hypothetical protein